MIRKFISQLLGLMSKHRRISAAVIVFLLIGGYFILRSMFGAKTETRYVLAQAERGTVMSTVTGTGQVSASNQVDIKAKASGDALAVNIKNGQTVKKNDLMVQLNAKEAYKSVRDAQTNLETVKLALEKLQQPATDLEILQAENALASAEDAERKAGDNIVKSYEDAFNAIDNAFLNFPTIISGLNDTLYGYAIGRSEATIGGSTDNISALKNSLAEEDKSQLTPFEESAVANYKIARAKYDANFADYKKTDRSADQATIEALLDETLGTARALAQAAKSESNYLDTWVDIRTDNKWSIFTQVKTYQSGLSTYISQASNHLSTLLSLQTAISDYRQAKLDAQTSIKVKQATLDDLRAGTDPLDLRSSELSVQSRANALIDAQETYANYSVRAPFDGQVASVSVKLGDSVSSGGAIATLITAQKIATISVNEVDVAKIKVGQKVTLTFDAVSDLSISGEVIDVDTLGSVSQGVVSYNVKIGFDTQDERIKPGMSVSATVITDIKQDIVIVPNAAIKSQGSGNYVLVVASVDDASSATSQGIVLAAAPESRSVVIGVSDDNNTEITSGLNEGEYVVVKTTTASIKTSTQAPSLLQSLSPQRNSGTSRTSTSGSTRSSNSSGGNAGFSGPPGD